MAAPPDMQVTLLTSQRDRSLLKSEYWANTACRQRTGRVRSEEIRQADGRRTATIEPRTLRAAGAPVVQACHRAHVPVLDRAVGGLGGRAVEGGGLGLALLDGGPDGRVGDGGLACAGRTASWLKAKRCSMLQRLVSYRGRGRGRTRRARPGGLCEQPSPGCRNLGQSQHVAHRVCPPDQQSRPCLCRRASWASSEPGGNTQSELPAAVPPRGQLAEAPAPTLLAPDLRAGLSSCSKENVCETSSR